MPKTTVQVHVTCAPEDAGWFPLEDGQEMTVYIRDTILELMTNMRIAGTWAVDVNLRKLKKGERLKTRGTRG